MRIEEIKFENFRKYVNTSIKFPKNSDNDIHVVIAENGAGKTTFLNAMTWCLYNQEPKIKDKDRALPTLNTEISNTSSNDFEKASVSITVSGEGLKLIYKRSDIFKIHDIHSEYYQKNNKREEFINQEFSVTEIEGSKTNVCRDKDECEYLVSSFIPEAIKEFFFFDGEQLENYFLISKAIKDQVFKLSHIFVLDEMKRKIESKLTNLRKEGNPNSNSESKLKEFNDKNTFLQSEIDRYGKLKETYEKLEKERDDLLEKLGNTPSIKKAEQNRQRKIEQKDDLNDSLDEKKKQLNDIIIQQTPKIFAHDAFKKSLELIEENKDESYIYPIDASILEDSITDHSCKVCDRAIDEKLIEILNNKKAKLYLISPEERILSEHEKIFNKYAKISKNYLNSLKSVNKDIDTFNNTINTLENEIKELYEEIELNKHLKEKIDRRDELVKILPNKKSELDSLHRNNQSLEKTVRKLHDEYLQSLEDEEEYKDILAKIKLCTDALTVINDVKEGMMADTRNTIQDATNEKFFKLIRKSQSYGFIEISEDYRVNLYDDDGRPASATASASEVELLALAFILAIHSVSGFESPLVVDTLLARTSGQQRLNVSQSCINVSEEKQMLLFLIDEEYTTPVKTLFHENHVLEYKLVESESEKQIEIREM